MEQLNNAPTEEIVNPRPTTEEEVNDVIKALGKRKAPGEDKITNLATPSKSRKDIGNYINQKTK